MTPKVITFDCAQTIVRVRYNPADLAVNCAADVGLKLDEDEGRSLYMRLLQGSWTHYRQLNASRDSAACQAFWAEIGADWLAKLNLPTDAIDGIMAAGDRRLYGPDSEVFSLFDDTIPCLNRLKAEGRRMAVISNWDFTLHRVLQTLGLTGYFEKVFASLEEGVEKPDPGLFQIAAKNLGVGLEEVVHVGDDPVDDYQGALAAGCGAILVDRDRSATSGRVVPSLDSLEEALACC